MIELGLKPAAKCRWDLVALGEVMLRLDPGESRIATTRHFRAWEGGGEYNVARGLRRCFGLETAIVTALVRNPIGGLVEDLIYQGGVDQSLVKWVPDDGVGRTVRNGLNFTERGFGVRGAVGCPDRGNTAASQLRAGDIDWNSIFGRDGARWFHCGGIFAALSPTTPEVAREAMEAARRHGTIVSYDLNYRDSLWRSLGGRAAAQRVNRELAPLVDVMFGNEEDFGLALGFDVPSADPSFTNLDVTDFGRMMSAVSDAYNLKIVAVTLRTVRSATLNDWGAACYYQGELSSQTMEQVEIMDRVGGGDSFASGFIYGLLKGERPERALAYGVAHGALAMTTPGDTSMASLDEVERLMSGVVARIRR